MFTLEQDEILLESGTNEVEFLVVEVCGQLFGINVAKIRSIQQYDPSIITPIPDSNPAILGMWRERTDTITLVDLAIVLKKQEPPKLEREIVIVCEFNKQVRSFRVQGVKRIYRISWEEFTPIKEFMPVNSHVVGSVFIDDHEIMILDLEQIVVQIFPEENIFDEDEFMGNATVRHDRSDILLLFAEDSSLIRTTLSAELKKAGFSHLKDFDNGLDLYKYFTALIKDKPAGKKIIVLSDVEMPKMDGLTLTRRIREEHPEEKIPVVIFSSLVNDQLIHKCESVGADRAVAKPSYSELIKVLDEFL